MEIILPVFKRKNGALREKDNVRRYVGKAQGGNLCLGFNGLGTLEGNLWVEGFIGVFLLRQRLLPYLAWWPGRESLASSESRCLDLRP